MNQRCPSCGGEWFSPLGGITVSTENRITAYEPPLLCMGCGTPLTDGSLPPGAGPDLRALLRERARLLARADPGVWMAWKTYDPHQDRAARVHASEIRTGKNKTISELVGQVDARIAKLRDGRFQVQVSRLEHAPERS